MRGPRTRIRRWPAAHGSPRPQRSHERLGRDPYGPRTTNGTIARLTAAGRPAARRLAAYRRGVVPPSRAALRRRGHWQDQPAVRATRHPPLSDAGRDRGADRAIAELDGAVCGIAALRDGDGLGELRSLAVDESVQGTASGHVGAGDRPRRARGAHRLPVRAHRPPWGTSPCMGSRKSRGTTSSLPRTHAGRSTQGWR